MKALINLSSKINIILLRYILKLGLKICHKNVKVQKINNSTLKSLK